MHKLIKISILFCMLGIAGCNYITYTPRSKKNIRRETPSLLIFDRIVDFRTEQMGWPVSSMDFTSKGIKYYEVFENFPYQQTDFKIIDSNTMAFSFAGHIQDIKNYKETGKVDLNSYGGSVRLFKEKINSSGN